MVLIWRFYGHFLPSGIIHNPAQSAAEVVDKGKAGCHGDGAQRCKAGRPDGSSRLSICPNPKHDATVCDPNLRTMNAHAACRGKEDWYRVSQSPAPPRPVGSLRWIAPLDRTVGSLRWIAPLDRSGIAPVSPASTATACGTKRDCVPRQSRHPPKYPSPV